MPRHPGNLLASRTNGSGLSDHQIGKGISRLGFIWVSIKLMHERNKISIEFPYDVLYDSDSGQKKR
uniref:Uncharacterized protein n=1 Tax=Solanum tuberosum TaxID=4113 RepID=M1CRT7_SOLTU